MEPSQFIYNGPEDAAACFIFAHGAGAPMDSEFMNIIALGVAQAGIRVVRFEFPYMADRRVSGKKRPPNPAPRLQDHWRAVITAHSSFQRLYIGGKSMGGRMASLIADEQQPAGLICLGYPFHPPGKPERTRTEHLQDLKTPTLILQGTRDTMGKSEEVAGYQLSPAIRIHWLEDGDHSLKPRVKSGRTNQQNLDETIDQIQTFVG